VTFNLNGLLQFLLQNKHLQFAVPVR